MGVPEPAVQPVRGRGGKAVSDIDTYEKLDAWMRAAEKRFGLALSGYVLPYLDYDALFAAALDRRVDGMSTFWYDDRAVLVTVRGRAIYKAAHKEWPSVVLDWDPKADEAARGIANAYLAEADDRDGL